MNIEESQRRFMKSVDKEPLTIGDYALIAFVLFVIFAFVFSQPMAEIIYRLTK